MLSKMEGLIPWQSATPMPDLAKRTKDPEWERKQRQREYRVAARREKRNRKADEKKQRKLNATILRRMTRNPDKYTKNADRNRLRAIEKERRAIQGEAIKQAQRLAAIHDPTGVKFNIGPVRTLEDGRVISLESLKRREERKALVEAQNSSATAADHAEKQPGARNETENPMPIHLDHDQVPNNVSEDKNPLLESRTSCKGLSKSQQKKIAALQPRPPPPKPTLPEGVSIPTSEEEWLALWDLADEELERRVQRAKRSKAAERKALRRKQQSGKVERRAARDEKRKVYRDLKLTWKLIREKEKKFKTTMTSLEEQESKKIAVTVAEFERRRALHCCAELGFTLDNTPGIDEIKPRVLGMKGQTVNFEELEMGDSLNDVKIKTGNQSAGPKTRRVDLSTIAGSGSYVAPLQATNSGAQDDFIGLETGDGEDHKALDYNHKTRRKLRRALEAAQVQKEMLVRERARSFCAAQGIHLPPELSTLTRPVHKWGHRIQEDGSMETTKAERVRSRLELAEFNKAARVLRKQAKEIALASGLRVHAEMTGRLPSRHQDEVEQSVNCYGVGWHVPSDPDSGDFVRPEDVNILA